MAEADATVLLGAFLYASGSAPDSEGIVSVPLPEILPLVLCATIADADDFTEIDVWRLPAEVSASLLARLRTAPAPQNMAQAYGAQHAI